MHKCLEVASTQRLKRPSCELFGALGLQKMCFACIFTVFFCLQEGKTCIFTWFWGLERATRDPKRNNKQHFTGIFTGLRIRNAFVHPFLLASRCVSGASFWVQMRQTDPKNRSPGGTRWYGLGSSSAGQSFGPRWYPVVENDSLAESERASGPVVPGGTWTAKEVHDASCLNPLELPQKTTTTIM